MRGVGARGAGAQSAGGAQPPRISGRAAGAGARRDIIDTPRATSPHASRAPTALPATRSSRPARLSRHHGRSGSIPAALPPGPHAHLTSPVALPRLHRPQVSVPPRSSRAVAAAGRRPPAAATAPPPPPPPPPQECRDKGFARLPRLR